MRRRRLPGLAGALGGPFLLGSLAVQATVRAPDSHQFHPALTSAQGLREIVAPTLTVLGLVGVLAAVVAADRRDRPAFGGLYLAGALATVGGLGLALVGYAGLAVTDTATGSLGILGGLVFALLALAGVAVGGVGTGVLGVARLRGPRRADRLVGGLLVAGPLVVGAASLVGLGAWTTLVPGVGAVAYAALGVDVFLTPEREPRG